VHVGGDQSSDPTYFEVVASDRLVPSLKSAVVYALSVLSQRHSWLHRLLDYEDELLALVMFAVDWHSLSSTDATFAESLYGMRRRQLASASGASDVINSQQKQLALAAEVVLPYLRSKAERLYRLHANQGLLGLAVGRAAQQQQLSGEVTWQQRLRVHAVRSFVAAYPYLHAAMEGSTLAWHMAYLLGKGPAHRPVLHVLGMKLARVSAHDLMRQDRAKQAARAAALQATYAPGRHAAFGAVQRGALRGLALVSDHSRSALILGVFGFKALEWWFTSAEGRLAAGKAVPPPPPPPPIPPARGGTGLPADPCACPLCRRPCTSPAQLSVSGYVFCYQCVFPHVMQHGVCPVTLLPATLDHVRRLYDAA